MRHGSTEWELASDGDVLPHGPVTPKPRSQPANNEIDTLYALPLDEFTPARDELARRLRGEGARDAAAEVKRLRKPNLIAWALNYVRHRDAELIYGLIEAGERLQEAQKELVAGGERGLLRDAAAEERRLVDEVVARAEQELRAAGHPVSATVQSKLWASVHAAAVSPEPRDLLRSGRLLRDYEVSDLGLMGAGPAAAVPAREPPRAADTRERTAPRRAKREAAEREAAERDEAERNEAERKARSIRRELERARGQQEKLAAKRDDARRRANEAAREAARAQAELERAHAALEQAEARVADADERVRGLEAELDGLEL
jgi:hypothetical protein